MRARRRELPARPTRSVSSSSHMSRTTAGWRSALCGPPWKWIRRSLNGSCGFSENVPVKLARGRVRLDLPRELDHHARAGRFDVQPEQFAVGGTRFGARRLTRAAALRLRQVDVACERLLRARGVREFRRSRASRPSGSDRPRDETGRPAPISSPSPASSGRSFARGRGRCR